MGNSPINPVRGSHGTYIKFDQDEFDGHIKKVEIPGADKDDITFGELASGDTQLHTLKVTAVVDPSTGSFWRKLWDNPAGHFNVVIGFGGNAVPTAAQPHFVGTVFALGRPPIATEATKDRKRAEFEIELEFDDVPNIVEA